MAEKQGFFKRLVSGLTKTRDNIVSGMDSIFHGFSKIDDDFYEELEETLIMGDLGVRATMNILDDLKEKVRTQHIKEPMECRQLLIDSIKEQMDVGETAYEFEERTSVVFVIGVNGVGKTTTCINLVAALKKRNRKVLLVDCDPQGNSTSGMGVSKDRMPNVYDLLVRGTALAECIEQTPYGDVLPANRELSGATVELVDMQAREYVLKTALIPARELYDYIFVDCPPSLELLTVNALAAADSVLIPVQCEYYALEGIADLMTTVKLTKRTFNPELEVQGIVLTMYDSRTNFSEQVAAEVEKFFGSSVYKTRIPRAVRIAESPSHGMPVIKYDRMSRGSRAYLHLADELIRREE